MSLIYDNVSGATVRGRFSGGLQEKQEKTSFFGLFSGQLHLHTCR